MIKHEQKTWLPFMMVGFAAATFLISLASFTSAPTVAAPEINDLSVSVLASPVDVDEYQGQVQAILQQYSNALDAEAAASSLLILRVPADFKETHLNLVLTLNAIHAGESGATEKLNQLIENISWLTL
jgi:hypothetical protein